MQENAKALNEDNAIINQPKLLGAIDRILIKKSIAKRVSDIQPLKGPVGIISGAQWDKVTGKLTIAKADIEAVTKKIRTEFTIESLQDLQRIYKESFYDLLAHYLVDEMAYKIDEDFINIIKTRAELKDTLVFDNSFDKDLLSVGQSIAISINKGLADLPISDNRASLGWAVISSNVSSILGLTTNINNVEEESDDSPSYLGRINGVDYYIDYTYAGAVDYAVFGIKGNGFSKGSTIYCPYRQDWIETTDAITGEQIFFLMHRSGIEINPLDKEYYDGGAGTSGFLGKIDIDLSGMEIFN